MKIEAVCDVKGRGKLITITLDAPSITAGGFVLLKTPSDGSESVEAVRGIEWWCIPRSPTWGDKVGILISPYAEIKDDTEVFLQDGSW